MSRLPSPLVHACESPTYPCSLPRQPPPAAPVAPAEFQNSLTIVESTPAILSRYLVTPLTLVITSCTPATLTTSILSHLDYVTTQTLARLSGNAIPNAQKSSRKFVPKPFGGIQVILVGAMPIPEMRSGTSKSGRHLLEFADPVWNKFKVTPLTIQASIGHGSGAPTLPFHTTGLFSSSAMTPRHRMNRTLLTTPSILAEPVCIRGAIAKVGGGGNDTLDLSGRSYGDDIVSHLSAIVDELPLIRHLNLRDNRLTDKVIKKIVMELTRPDNPMELWSLDLSGNNIDMETALHLAEFIRNEEGTCFIKTLTLAKADLDDEEVSLLSPTTRANKERRDTLRCDGKRCALLSSAHRSFPPPCPLSPLPSLPLLTLSLADARVLQSSQPQHDGDYDRLQQEYHRGDEGVYAQDGAEV